MKELDFHKIRYMAGKIDRREFWPGDRPWVTAGAASMIASDAVRAGRKRGPSAHRDGHGSTTDSMDSATFENGFTGAISGASFNQLGQVKADGQVHPISPKTGRPRRTPKPGPNLRKGVTFHNGKSVEAEDVLASFQHHMGKDSKSAAKSLLDQVVSLKADGKHAVFSN